MDVLPVLPEDLSTPYLMIDVDVLARNVQRMASLAQARGLALRPHAKTHKCVEIARRQVDLGAAGLTVATVGEAEVFAAAGFTDLFIAFTLWATGPRATRLRALSDEVSLRVGVDSVAGAEVLGRALAGCRVEVLVEVDSGHHRSGVHPHGAGTVAAAAADAGLAVSGVFTFPGHGYGLGHRGQAALEEAEALEVAAAAVTEAGFPAAVRSGGSTPTADLSDAATLTEMRPGVYVFNDAQQVELGSCSWADVALTAAATVVSRRGTHVVLDAGSKVLGADQPVWATGAGRLPDYPDARIVALAEHHATVALPPDSPVPALGQALRIAPNHVCAAVNLADELIVVARGRSVDRWRVAARGRNT
jgi:D-serine deaminase-like pyridoxal phosphate-dependent protein